VSMLTRQGNLFDACYHAIVRVVTNFSLALFVRRDTARILLSATLLYQSHIQRRLSRLNGERHAREYTSEQLTNFLLPVLGMGIHQSLLTRDAMDTLDTVGRLSVQFGFQPPSKVLSLQELAPILTST
jgi:hypothetical protein